MTALGCAPCKGGAFQWVQAPPGNPLQPEAIGAVMEVTKWLKPSISVSRIGDSASVQAATRVNVEQASKRTMCRPTRLPYRGRLKWLDELSEDYAPLLHRGIGGGMYTRKFEIDGQRHFAGAAQHPRDLRRCGYEIGQHRLIAGDFPEDGKLRIDRAR